MQRALRHPKEKLTPACEEHRKNYNPNPVISIIGDICRYAIALGGSCGMGLLRTGTEYQTTLDSLHRIATSEWMLFRIVLQRIGSSVIYFECGQ
ncbi:hypothetical protein CEXT_809021 [Caerostris extrusa]|uniref:Uncharacterized protein n=1 Tax=Caerostris extrusa TaxID=172846 RepID=A0AAV4S5R5_CAEEX|nr:hypothetical protein CEXT_809021 [Caerostris extrusa]